MNEIAVDVSTALIDKLDATIKEAGVDRIDMTLTRTSEQTEPAVVFRIGLNGSCVEYAMSWSQMILTLVPLERILLPIATALKARTLSKNADAD